MKNTEKHTAIRYVTYTAKGLLLSTLILGTVACDKSAHVDPENESKKQIENVKKQANELNNLENPDPYFEEEMEGFENISLDNDNKPTNDPQTPLSAEEQEKTKKYNKKRKKLEKEQKSAGSSVKKKEETCKELSAALEQLEREKETQTTLEESLENLEKEKRTIKNSIQESEEKIEKLKELKSLTTTPEQKKSSGSPTKSTPANGINKLEERIENIKRELGIVKIIGQSFSQSDFEDEIQAETKKIQGLKKCKYVNDKQIANTKEGIKRLTSSVREYDNLQNQLAQATKSKQKAMKNLNMVNEKLTKLTGANNIQED